MRHIKDILPRISILKRLAHWSMTGASVFRKSEWNIVDNSICEI